jgi:hypothetical protein
MSTGTRQHQFAALIPQLRVLPGSFSRAGRRHTMTVPASLISLQQSTTREQDQNGKR